MSYKMNPREKALAYLVGGAFAFIINLFLIRFFLNTQAQLTRDSIRLQTQLRSMQNLLAKTSLWEERDAWRRDKQPVLENEARAGSDLLTQVQELARQHAVLVEQPAIANPERQPEYTAISVSLETKSTWKALIEFLHDLQGPEKFIVLEQANLKIDSQDQTQMRGRFKVAKWFAPKQG